MILIHVIVFFLFGILQSQSSHYQGEYGNDFLQKHVKKFVAKPKNNEMQSLTKYEPFYPKKSRFHSFPTFATEQEMAKHDRFIIHSLLYMDKYVTPAYLQKYWQRPNIKEAQGPWNFPKKVCINILVKNRKIPYSNALLMTLMGSHAMGEPIPDLISAPKNNRLLLYADFNIVDTERHNHNYDETRRKLFQLPFVHFHPYNSYTNILQNSLPSSIKLNKILDYIKSAKICIESELEWCLMMQEYTVVPHHFLNALKQQVIGPLESYAASHRLHPHETNDEVFMRMKKMSVVSLFSAYNSDLGSIMNIQNAEYSTNQYKKDRALLNSERKSMDLEKASPPSYEFYPIDSSDVLQGGYDSALLFRTQFVKTRLLPMLEELKTSESARILSDSLRNKKNSIVQKTHSEFDLEREIAAYSGIKRYRLEPSLVNRIGFYDEYFGEALRTKEEMPPNKMYDPSIGITNWLTDPRFYFELGAYEEGRDYFCEKEGSGLWIEDGLYDEEDDHKSCCKKKYFNHEKCVD